MSYDEDLDARLADAVREWGADRRKMFGGTCYLLNGNMLAGVYKDSLILRLGEEAAAEALARPSVRPFDITGRPMKGWVMVDPPGADGDAIERWLGAARSYVDTLPSKER